MATLRDIKPSILSMEYPAALDLVLSIRNSRLVPKKESRVAKSKPAQKVKAVEKSVDSLSADEARRLLELLGD